MSVRIHGQGDPLASALPLLSDPSNSGSPVHFVVVDIETHGGEKKVGDRNHFILTSKFACAALYDSETNWTYFYGPEQLESLVGHLENSEVVVSFNGRGYDMPVMENLLGRRLRLKKHVDLFEMIVNVTGDMKGYSLEAVASATLGYGKIGKGVWASELLAQGVQAGEASVTAIFNLIGYCAHDVRLTRNLIRFARDNGFVLSGRGIVNLVLPDIVKRLA